MKECPGGGLEQGESASPPGGDARTGAESGRVGGGFPLTRWSIVLAARDGSTSESARALEDLCRDYWHPLYGYARRSGCPPEEAEDVTQEFIADLLRRGSLAAVKAENGKLRSFLVVAFKHFLCNHWRREKTKRRGGGTRHISIDGAAAEGQYALEPAHSLTPERLFERRWALCVLDRTMETLRREFEERSKKDEFETLLPFLPWNSGADYEEAARALGITAGAARVAVHRFRKRYREALVAQIADTVSEPSEIEKEISFLLTVFD